MTTKPHGYLIEPKWFARNLEPEIACENLAVYLAVILIVAFAGYMMLPIGG